MNHRARPWNLLFNGDFFLGTRSKCCWGFLDRKSTRLNSSHLVISYAVFCLKKKKKAYDALLCEMRNEPYPLSLLQQQSIIWSAPSGSSPASSTPDFGNLNPLSFTTRVHER